MPEGDQPAPTTAAPVATPPPAPAATAPAAPDLDGLQTVLDKAKRDGAGEELSKLLGQLGFDKIEDAQAFITTKREADTAALTEVERREKAAADRETAAQKRETDAADLINRGVIRNALQTAGVPVAALDDAEGLVKITGDITAETATEAVTALKAKPAFASLFTEPVTTVTAPSGVSGAGAPRTSPPAQNGLEAGRDLARKEREETEKKDPLRTLHVVGGQKSA